MGQQQPPYDHNDQQNDQSDLDRTQPSPTRPPRRLDWRPPDYQAGDAEPAEDAPPVRRVTQPSPRRRPPTEGAPAWLVGGLVGVLLAVIAGLALLFFLSRPSAEPEPTATVFLVSPTATLAPRPTFTPPPSGTATPEPTAEDAPEPTAPVPDAIRVGGYVQVVAPAGLSFREVASTDGALIQVLDNGTVLEVIGGPETAGGYTWWQLRKVDDDREGWSAAGADEDIFLEPASAP